MLALRRLRHHTRRRPDQCPIVFLFYDSGNGDGVVDFLFKWEEENCKRTGTRSTQGPDQIIPYATRRSFVLMHKSLGRLVNLFEEIHVSSITQKICFASLVTLIESFFSLMREDDPMPTQLAYGTRRSTCVRELDKRMYDG